ncbi:MAG: GntR family transcriptional regulator, transcriptional repressor for pyruvate dehydrogenase complex [Solirubrobacteraceae bacterium]|jgi:DNA-binding FadR family transcriptional regulator|nr:GntR family transcriptional regulator, transcriptional repressor for pyruvate dehydrogenase complex [Solirubrobacteraceae bacterium]
MTDAPEPPVVVDSADAFQALDRRSLAHDAAEHLRELIGSGALQPGDKLPSERALASRLGVSRPTLREAVRGLVIMGLLETRHGAGTFVVRQASVDGNALTVTVDLQDAPIEELFEIRLLLEPSVTERAAARATESELAELHAILERMDAVVAEPTAFSLLDAEFHRAIHVAARSATMLSLLDGIADLSLRGRTLSSTRPGVTRRTTHEHRAILDALDARDPVLAREAMAAHLMHIRGVLIGRNETH